MRSEFVPMCVQGETRAIGGRIAVPLRGEALEALRGSELRHRFYSWRARSGRRYVCSVFAATDKAVVAECWSAAVIGVANDAGARRPVYVMTSGEFRALTESDARAEGVNEWHVHFGADKAELRDLAESLAF